MTVGLLQTEQLTNGIQWNVTHAVVKADIFSHGIRDLGCTVKGKAVVVSQGQYLPARLKSTTSCMQLSSKSRDSLNIRTKGRGCSLGTLHQQPDKS